MESVTLKKERIITHIHFNVMSKHKTKSEVNLFELWSIESVLDDLWVNYKKYKMIDFTFTIETCMIISNITLLLKIWIALSKVLLKGSFTLCLNKENMVFAWIISINSINKVEIKV